MSDPVNTILNADCIAGMNALQPGSVDLVFADPPFNIGYDYDLVGNVLWRDSLSGGTTLRESFAYDELQRLTGSSVQQNGVTAGSVAYTYDGDATPQKLPDGRWQLYDETNAIDLVALRAGGRRGRAGTACGQPRRRYRLLLRRER